MCGASFYLKGEKIMLKKTIPYIDLNGVERKEDFYFHLSKPEIVKMQTSVKGGYDVQLKSIGASRHLLTVGIFSSGAMSLISKADNGLPSSQSTFIIS